ncbi:tRNA (uracil-5-)-methyltransferase [Bacterioplanoides sp.]|uniref:tRNA (uracil-5-)-methyltransferase n=1 Tax=Bacterioplanoides sp. TaxID=2066072 RepID=UPI003B00BC35
MSNNSSSSNVVDFARASQRRREDNEHQRKEAQVNDIRQRFEKALPEKKTPVKDFLKKKKAKKKR